MTDKTITAFLRMLYLANNKIYNSGKKCAKYSRNAVGNTLLIHLLNGYSTLRLASQCLLLLFFQPHIFAPSLTQLMANNFTFIISSF